MNLRTLFSIVLVVFSLQLVSQKFSIEINKTNNRIFQKTDSLMTVNFKIFEITNSQLAALKSQADSYSGVISFEIISQENNEANVSATFIESFDEISFQKLLIYLNIGLVKIEDVEISSMKISEAFRNDPEYRKQLKLLNKRIKDIQAKIEWVMNTPEEKAIAEGNGWFEKAYQSLDEAKKEKKDLMENNNTKN